MTIAILRRLDVRAANGVPFRVVYIPVGETSPNFPTVVVANVTHLTGIDGDLVEFYDLRYPHTPDGQFVSRYYVDTLLRDIRGHELDLDGGIDDWTVDADTMRVVLGWLRNQRLLCHLPTPTSP